MADTIPLEDNARLTDKLSEEILQKYLDEIISVQLVVDMHDGTESKVKMLYFLKNDKVFMITEQELLMKNWKELEHALYLLQLKDDECKRWADRIEMTFHDRKKVIGLRKEKFTPKYIDYYGKETEMKKNGATLQTTLRVTYLMFNSESAEVSCIFLGERMKVSKIESIIVAIYQTSESEEEQKKIHDEMIKLLMAAEQKLMDKFLERSWKFQSVADLKKKN